MKDEPADISRDDIERLLNEHWGFQPAEVAYAPVGFGCYHWIASDGSGPRWFVTANYLDPHGSWLGPTAEATRVAVKAAATASKELAGNGYDFIVAPLPDRTGLLVRDILPNWTLEVLPYLDGWSTPDGEWHDPAEQVQIAGLLGRLHSAKPPTTLRRWDSGIPGRARFLTAVGELDQPWTGGPYSEATRQRLVETLDGVHAMFAHYDALVRDLEASGEPWVVTHGEPHSANVVRTGDGRMHLIDCDSMLLAPRERDLEALPEDARAGVLSAYQEHAGPYRPRPEVIELFHVWWALAEICGYVGLFRGPHTDSLDSKQSWQNLLTYLPG